MTELKQYLGVKLIKATPMTLTEYNTKFDRVVPATKGEDGYLVQYSDDYQSWSPKTVFEEAYRTIDGELTFGLAIEAMKLGKKVARTGWNGKGMYLYLVPSNKYKTVTDVAKKEFGDEFEAGAYITMKPASGPLVIGWLASQTDILAEDWCIIE